MMTTTNPLEERSRAVKERLIQITVAVLFVLAALALWDAFNEAEAATVRSTSSSQATQAAPTADDSREARAQARASRAYGRVAEAYVRSSGLTNFYSSDSDLRVRFENGELEATQGGEPVPAERILRTDEYIIILDEDGRALYQILFDEQGDMMWSGNLLSSRPLRRTSGGLRIGIGTGRVDEALAAQLDIDADDATLVRHVTGEGPAEEAGVRKFDIITRIDGNDDASANRLRRVLREMEEGDTIELLLLRGGSELTVTVTPRRDIGFFNLSDLRRGDTGSISILPNDWEFGGGAVVGVPDAPSVFFPEGDGPVMVVPPTVPVAPALARPVDRERMERLEERLERLEALLRELLEEKDR